MLLKHLLNLYELLDSPAASGETVKAFLEDIDPACNVETYALSSEKGETDMVRIRIPGAHGKSTGGDAPTIGLLGRLGGLGARPERIGFVSDGDGALVALACAAKLIDMHAKGDVLAGDVFISTHVCPHAPTMPHKPVPFMGSPVATAAVNKEEVTEELDAILVVDTTKGNRIANYRGFAISPTVKQGVILRVSEDLLDLVEIATGRKPQVFALSMADITPYGNGLYHLNSVLQPATATDAPVVGVAITTETAVPGCATGATHLSDLDEAGTFMIEAAKAFGEGSCSFFDAEEFELFGKRYGSMAALQTMGALPAEDEMA
ncbi:DUF1177 domain-containing protein [Raoultibacter massiliensis]|uniref:DUF1177 domain-containing protein n=1 Tax=Raoultibacter massiliensis TaxID=1852371 RepID=UPI000C84ADEB|nr:DUF1177 domain-containing protein [Raoultibacter massiliensis]